MSNVQIRYIGRSGALTHGGEPLKKGQLISLPSQEDAEEYIKMGGFEALPAVAAAAAAPSEKPARKSFNELRGKAAEKNSPAAAAAEPAAESDEKKDL